MRRRVELGNVLTLELALPKGFRLLHEHYPKPDSDGRRRFQVPVRNVTHEDAGLRVGVQFLTDGVAAARGHRLQPAMFASPLRPTQAVQVSRTGGTDGGLPL
jgi:hypothetical protein